MKSILHDLQQGESSVTEYFNVLYRHWQQLDIYEKVSRCGTKDKKKYKELGTDRIYKFLLGLNNDLDENHTNSNPRGRGKAYPTKKWRHFRPLIKRVARH